MHLTFIEACLALIAIGLTGIVNVVLALDAIVSTKKWTPFLIAYACVAFISGFACIWTLISIFVI